MYTTRVWVWFSVVVLVVALFSTTTTALQTTTTTTTTITTDNHQHQHQTQPTKFSCDDEAHTKNRKRSVVNINQQYSTTSLPTKTNTSPIRISVETAYMGGDSATCYTVGQIVQYLDYSDYVFKNHNCTSNDILTANKTSLMVSLVSTAITTKIRPLFNVVPILGNLTLNRVPCSINSIGNNYRASNTDLVIFLMGRFDAGTVDSSNTLAVRENCIIDQYNRPIAAMLNINPTKLLTTDDVTAQVNAITHQILHILGFDYEPIQRGYFRNNAASIINTYTYTYANGEADYTEAIVSPSLLQHARQYYGCNQMSFVPMENEDAGFSRCHWAARNLKDEIMTHEVSSNSIISNFTLKLLEDSNFYSINYGSVGVMTWGAGQGCAFWNASCAKWNEDYFCKSAQSGCSADFSRKTLCNLTATNIPVDYQYFNSSTIGGNNRFMDYCPSPTFATRGNCGDSSNSAYASANHGETFCADCKCVISSINKASAITSSSVAPICYQTHCISSTNQKIKVDKYWYDCPTNATQPLRVPNFGGELLCPETVKACLGKPVDTNWLGFSSIEPASAFPSAAITIYGQGFTSGMLVTVGGPCGDVRVINGSIITARLPSFSSLLNQTIGVHLVGISLEDTDGKRTSVSDVFYITIASTGPNDGVIDYDDVTSSWLQRNLAIVIAIAVVGGFIVILCLISACVLWFKLGKTCCAKLFGCCAKEDKGEKVYSAPSSPVSRKNEVEFTAMETPPSTPPSSPPSSPPGTPTQDRRGGNNSPSRQHLIRGKNNTPNFRL